jgi:hypothetical protein
MNGDKHVHGAVGVEAADGESPGREAHEDEVSGGVCWEEQRHCRAGLVLAAKTRCFWKKGNTSL